MPLRLEIVSQHVDLDEGLLVREFAACGGTIGRAPDNDWVLPDDKRYVSSRHAVLDFQAGAYYLVDTSRNGVFVNGSDTPVGRGHPQRIFDGDRLRIGEYEIKVAVYGNEEEIPDDGMRDSIVRAQLVREDPSVELLLMDEEKMLRDSSFQRHLTPAPDLSAKVRSARATDTATALPPRSTAPKAAKPAAAKTTGQSGTVRALNTSGKGNGAAAPAATRTPPTLAAVVGKAAPRPAADAETRALHHLLEAAGLKPETVAGATSKEVLQLAGKLLRVSVAGLMDLLRERNQLLDGFRISQATAQSSQNNPLRFSPNVDEALRYLLSDRGPQGGDADYLVAEDAIRTALRELRQHEQALFRAILQAARDYADHFDPDELKNRFDRGLKRTGLLSGANKLKYWDLYQESYPALTQREEGGPPQLFSEEFARAYTEEMEAAKAGRNR